MLTLKARVNRRWRRAVARSVGFTWSSQRTKTPRSPEIKSLDIRPKRVDESRNKETDTFITMPQAVKSDSNIKETINNLRTPTSNGFSLRLF